MDLDQSHFSETIIFKKEFRDLIGKLSQDPKVREAIHKIGKFGDNPNFTALPQAMVAAILFAGRFFGKSRMRALANFVDAAVFLVSLSLLIKQNVFDKPEVQDFVRKTWKDIGKTATHLTQVVRDYVDRRLNSRSNKTI